MSFSSWFDCIEKGGERRSQRFYGVLNKLFESPSYTEHVVEWLEEAYNTGRQDAATQCRNLCSEQADFLLRFSQYGSNAAKDCASLINDTFLEGKNGNK